MGQFKWFIETYCQLSFPDGFDEIVAVKKQGMFDLCMLHKVDNTPH